MTSMLRLEMFLGEELEPRYLSVLGYTATRRPKRAIPAFLGLSARPYGDAVTSFATGVTRRQTAVEVVRFLAQAPVLGAHRFRASTR